MGDDGLRELAELSGKGPRKVVGHFSCGDIELAPPSLMQLVELEKSGLKDLFSVEYMAAFVHAAAVKAGSKLTREEFMNRLDFSDLPELGRVIELLNPPQENRETGST